MIHRRVVREWSIWAQDCPEIAVGDSACARELIKPDQPDRSGRRVHVYPPRALHVPDPGAVGAAAAGVPDLCKPTRPIVSTKLNPGTGKTTTGPVSRRPASLDRDIAMETRRLAVATMSDEGVVARSGIRRDKLFKAGFESAGCRDKNILGCRNLDGRVDAGGVAEVVGAP